MISEEQFFNEMMNDILPAAGGDDEKPVEEKETFTRAEVEQIVMEKVKTLKEELENGSNEEQNDTEEGGTEEHGEE